MQFGLIGDGYYSHVGDLQKNHHLHPVVQASPLGHTMPRALIDTDKVSNAKECNVRVETVTMVLHVKILCAECSSTTDRHTNLFEYNERASALAVRERFPIVDPPFSLKQATSASAGSLPQKNGIILYRVNGKFFR